MLLHRPSGEPNARALAARTRPAARYDSAPGRLDGRSGHRHSSAHDPRDTTCRLGGGLVLPDPHARPALRGESPVGVAVAAAVRLDLFAPPRRVRARLTRVLRAPVPEAAVDEHGDARGTGRRCRRGAAAPEAEAEFHVSPGHGKRGASSGGPDTCPGSTRRARQGVADPGAERRG